MFAWPNWESEFHELNMNDTFRRDSQFSSGGSRRSSSAYGPEFSAVAPDMIYHLAPASPNSSRR